MKGLTAALTLCGFTLCASAVAQQAPTKPKELEILGQYVGHWTSDVTSKPAEWDQKGTKYGTINQAELILDGWFLQHIEVNHVVGDPDKVTKSLFLWTYDPKLEKFVAWAFQSDGNVASSTGKWDSTSKAFTLATVEPPPNTTGKMTEQFVDANTIKGNLTFIDDAGKTLMDMEWTRKRQAEAAGKATREQWNRIGTPIQALPDELKKLQPLVGEWDSVILPPGPLLEPSDIRSKGKMTIQWILDGRHLLITTENGMDRFIWVIWYDPAKGKYRRITFTNAGEIAESLGAWNGEFGTIDWRAVNERRGPTRLGQDIIGIDQVDLERGREILRISIMTVDDKGRLYGKLTSSSTRRK
jgi:hypothetical protein